MPTTVSGLLLFVALLTPGLVYLVRTETRLPGRQYTVLRETALVVSVSLLANTLVLGLFGILRTLWSGGTPDPGSIVRDPGTYLRGHYVMVTLWGAGLLLVAVVVAALIAVPPAWSGRLLPRSGPWPLPTIRTAIERRQRSPIAPESGWGTAFFRYPELQVHLGLRLMDGTYLYGRLLTFSPQIEENDDRSLQLAGPVEIRTPSAEAPESMEADVVVVSARAIKTMSVHYLPDR